MDMKVYAAMVYAAMVYAAFLAMRFEEREEVFAIGVAGDDSLAVDGGTKTTLALRNRFAPPGYWLHLTQRGNTQLVPGMDQGSSNPRSARASRGKAAAKAVRTATKLSYGVTERYEAGF